MKEASHKRKNLYTGRRSFFTMLFLCLFLCILLSGCSTGNGKGAAEGILEGTVEGAVKDEGTVEGTVEDMPEGTVEGAVEGTTEGIAAGHKESDKEEMTDTDLLLSEDPAGYLRKKVIRIMVRIEAGRYAGSGVIVDSDEDMMTIATAGHVLEQAEDGIRVIFSDDFEISGEFRYFISEYQDLAFIRIPHNMLEEGRLSEKPLDHAIQYGTAVLSREAFDHTKAGDSVVAIGSKTGVGEDAYAGEVVSDYAYSDDFQAYVLIAQVKARPGMSGGGIFDLQGNLLGILCGISEDGQTAAVPVTAILDSDIW